MLLTLATVRRDRYIVWSNPPRVPADSKPKSLRCHEWCVFFLTCSAAVPVSCCIPPLILTTIRLHAIDFHQGPWSTPIPTATTPGLETIAVDLMKLSNWRN